MKYVPDYPERFASIGEARAWMEGFIGWYNDEHRHCGTGLYTPASAHYGIAEDVRVQRQATLDAAYATHPERSHRCPEAPKLPIRVTINDHEKTKQTTQRQHT